MTIKPSAWKFQRRDYYNMPAYWSVSISDPTNHPYRASGPIIPLYESTEDMITAFRFELKSAKDIHLAVVRRLQAEIDGLRREAEKDAKYTAWLRQSADDTAAMADRAYNCGEL